VVRADRPGQRVVVLEDPGPGQLHQLLRLVLERLLVLGGPARVDEVTALVRVGVVADRPGLGQRDDRVERLGFGHPKLPGLSRQLRRADDRQQHGDERRPGQRRVDQPPVADRNVELHADQDGEQSGAAGRHP
jgi:hypothetical protein